MNPSSSSAFHAFLSYNSEDRTAVRDIARRLVEVHRADGSGSLDFYFDEKDIQGGNPFQRQLADALRRSHAGVVFLGAHGLGPWQDAEVQVMNDRRQRDPGFRVIPVLLPGFDRPRYEEYPHLDFLFLNPWVEFLRDASEDRPLRTLLAWVSGRTLLPEAGNFHGERPYRGLLTFTEEFSRFFFGRENITGWLVDRLRREVRVPRGVRFLSVLGPSGTGKSSAVRAGMVPRIRDGAIEGSAGWKILVLKPENDSLKSLAVGLAALFPESGVAESLRVKSLVDAFRSDSQALDTIARARFFEAPPESRLLVVVDQFEEVFTYLPADKASRPRWVDDRQKFIDNLIHAATAAGGPVACVFTMRSDFLPACAPFPSLNRMISARQVQVGPMSEAELCEVIDNPASLTGCHIQEGLRELLLSDVRGEPGSLPLLEFTLDELWKRRDATGLLTVKAYQEIGGVQGALRQHAEEVYSELSGDVVKKEICRRVLVDLVHLGEGTRDIKRRLPYESLRGAHGPEAPLLHQVLESLQDARLVTTSADDSLYELAHEALIRGWPRLLEWLQAERDSELIRRQLVDAAGEWSKRGRDDGYLYRGSRLAHVSEWAGEHPGDVIPLVREFLEACHAHLRHEDAAKLAAARLADHRAGVASARRLAAHAQEAGDHQPQLRLLLAVEAVRAVPEDLGPAVPAALTALHRSLPGFGGTLLNGHQGQVSALAFAPDGRLGTVGNDQTVRVRDLTSPDSEPVVLHGHTDWVRTLAFASDDRLVTAGFDGEPRVWDLKSPGSEPVVLRGNNDTGSIYRLAVAPDGRFVTVAQRDKTWVWDLDSPGSDPVALRGLPVNVVADVMDVGFAPDGRLATGSGWGAMVWDLNSPKFDSIKFRISGGIEVLGFSTDGRLVTAGNDGFARVWNIDSPPSAPVVLRGQQGAIRAICFAPGNRVVTGGEDGTARVWDLNSPDSDPVVLRGHEGKINTICVDSNGRLAIAGDGGATRVWDLESPEPDPVVLRGDNHFIMALAFASDGRLVEAGSSTVRVWTLDVPSLLTLAADAAERNLTLKEWRKYFPDEPYRATFAHLGSPE